MRVGCLLAMTVPLFAAFPPGVAGAQGGASPFIGTWQLNRSQSVPMTGETAPAGLVTRIERMDLAHVRWTITTTDAQGQQHVETFDTPGNGEFYSLDGTTMVAHRLSPGAVQSTFRAVGGETDVLTCTLAAGNRQMTCSGAMTRPDGSTARYTDVFDRQ